MSSTISEEICKKISADIIAGVIVPGQKLEEKAIAEQFNVSRTPVRDAFRLLAGSGLVETKAHRGVTVISLNPEELADLFEALGEIEALCAKLAAQRMTTLERRKLENLHRQSRELVGSGGERAYSDINEEIHKLIHEGSQNETLMGLASDLWQRLAPFRRDTFFQHRDRMRQSTDEHDEVINAIVSGDKEQAFLSMRNHVANSSLNALAYVEENLRRDQSG